MKLTDEEHNQLLFTAMWFGVRTFALHKGIDVVPTDLMQLMALVEDIREARLTLEEGQRPSECELDLDSKQLVSGIRSERIRSDMVLAAHIWAGFDEATRVQDGD